MKAHGNQVVLPFNVAKMIDVSDAALFPVAEYICINEIGDLIKPGYLSVEFPKLLEKKGLRRIRFHDLRHSCASLLIANGVPMKQIQEWLGHSDFSTTTNIYSHLEYSSKLTSADALAQSLGL